MKEIKEKFDYERYISDTEDYAFGATLGGWPWPFSGIWYRLYTLLNRPPKLKDYERNN